MPRRKYKKVAVNNDPLYDSIEVTKLVNYVMIDGKKTVAQKVVYNALEHIKEEKVDPLELLHKAIANTSPQLEVRARRLGGASYMVPTEVRASRRLYLSLNWIVNAANTRSNKEYRSYAAKLAAELKDAAAGLGTAVTKKQQTEKQADQNKAFAHLKW